MLLPCGRWNSLGSSYFNLSSDVLNRTSSHMWGRWYLPIFLFRDGLLTLIYRASLMALMRFCSSLSTMLKFSNETWWPVVLKWSKIGEGALRCFLNLSLNVLDDSPMYSFWRNNNNQKKSGTDTNQKPYITVPYQRGLSESFKKTCNNHGVQVYFKGGTTIKNLLMAPKDQDPIKSRSGVIYRFKCNRVECDDEYIGESSRTFRERFKKHLKAPSPIFDHFNTTGHQVSLENFSIVEREEQNLMRAIKEALYIRVNNPSLNRNIGKYHLPHIWDEVLFNTSELKLK